MRSALGCIVSYANIMEQCSAYVYFVMVYLDDVFLFE